MKSAKIKIIKFIGIFFVAALILLLVAYGILSSGRDANQNSNERVVVFVLDAGDWRIINKMVSEGRLKNLNYLIENGVSGKLQSVYPLFTPPNMASMFTGKLPSKHGIKSHFDYSREDTKNQLYRNMKAKPLWEILRNKNITLDLVGFQEFDYAPRIDGTIVTGFYIIKKVSAYNSYFSDINGEMKFLKYIPDFLLVSKSNGGILQDYSFLENSEAIMKKSNISLNFDTEITHRMIPFVIEKLKNTEKSKKGNAEFSKLISGIETVFHSGISTKFQFELDMMSKEIALDLYKSHKSNIMFVYFAGTDIFAHNYYFNGWHMEDKKNEQRQVYEYYQIIDGYIGEFLMAADENTAFFVVSDHGAQNMTMAQYLYIAPHIPPHTKYGIFIAQGKQIKKGAKIENASITDITPTLLYIYNQPMAEDFDGKVLMDIFKDGYNQGKKTNYIETYELV